MFNVLNDDPVRLSGGIFWLPKGLALRFGSRKVRPPFYLLMKRKNGHA